MQSTLLADTYPITSRGRVGSTLSLFGSVTGTLSPLIVGGIATWIGGPNGWRWVFVILAIPISIVSIFGFLLPEPPRGQFEKQDVLGEVIEEEDPLPISVEAAFARLLQIRTLKAVITAFAAIGFGLFTVPILGNLFMEDEYGLGSFGRGAVGTVSGVAVMITRAVRRQVLRPAIPQGPELGVAVRGWMMLPSALLVPVQYFMPNPVLFAILAVPTAVLTVSAYAMVGPLLTSVIPYRLRGMGQALGALYIFFIGATGGALLAGLLSNAYGTRAAIIVLYVPSTIIGGSADPAERVVHPRRPATGVARASRGARRAPTATGEPRRHAGAPGQPGRLLVRPGADPVRRRLRGEEGRGAGAARHQRCGQVDDPAGHRRARHPSPRRGPAPRTRRHLRHTGDADPIGNPHVAGRQGRVQRLVDPREPRGGGVQPPQGPSGDARGDRGRAGSCSRNWPRGPTCRPRRCQVGSSRCWRSLRCSPPRPTS